MPAQPVPCYVRASKGECMLFSAWFTGLSAHHLQTRMLRPSDARPGVNAGPKTGRKGSPGQTGLGYATLCPHPALERTPYWNRTSWISSPGA